MHPNTKMSRAAGPVSSREGCTCRKNKSGSWVRFFLMWDSVGTALQELAHQDMQETRVNHGQGSFQPLPHSAPNEQCVKAARIVPHMSKEQTVALVPEHLKLWYICYDGSICSSLSLDQRKIATRARCAQHVATSMVFLCLCHVLFPSCTA